MALPALHALRADSSDPMLVRLLPVLQRSTPTLGALNTELQQVRQSTHLVPQLRTGVDQLATVLATAHPSPLSARRGFLGSRPFSRINAWLEAQGRKPVDWAA